MTQHAPKAWMYTMGLFAAVVAAALAVQAVSLASGEPEASVEADSCFRYGRLECCIKE